MAVPTQQRRLAAILAADVVGYARLMSEDETGTLARLKRHRAELVDPTIGEHHGRIVKLMGDGTLVEFASVVDAVRCAVEIQRAMAERNAESDPRQTIEFRIGINLGDIIIEGDDIYGEGVNLAARLEGLARPGGLCISDLVHQMVRARIDLAFEDLGEQHVKNIAQPVRVWQWTNDARAMEPPASRAEKVSALASADTPSLAVLPFDNLSRDPDQEYFSDGLTEDLITDLSQLSALFVTSRHAVFQYKGRTAPPRQVAKDLGVRYVLEGSIRRAANRVRINAQLIDAATGFHLWAQRYDRDLEDIFALQDEITGAIVAALELHLTPRERAGIERRYTENLEAYDLFLQAREGWRTREGAAQARTCLERGIALDPKFAAAHSLLADIYRSEWWFGWRDDEGALDRALELAQRGVALDDSLPLAHMFLGWIHLWRKEHDQAIAAAKRCLVLDPKNAEGHARLGHILDQAGRPAEGLPFIETAMRLDPHYPYLYLFWLAHVFHSLERYDEAIAAYRRTISFYPNFVPARAQLAAVYAQQERMEEAKAEAAEALRIDSGRLVQRYAQHLPFKDAAALARLLDGLHKAGLLE
jgi:adenylate cyclase